MKALIVNDTHIAASRKAGVTPASSRALQLRTLQNFEALLFSHTDLDIIHAGDLFDQFVVPNEFLLFAHSILSRWLTKSGKRFIALRSNHDWHPSADKLSSWKLLMDILYPQFPAQVVQVLDELKEIDKGVYALGHVSNQDLFEHELEKTMELQDSVLIAHANFENPFAAQAKHSLNITQEWAEAFVGHGNSLYCGHEHQKREVLGGLVVMLGSQDATSIADCLGNSAKFAHILNDDGSLEPIRTMDVDAEFIQVDWQDLEKVADQAFIRVTGQATAAQAESVIDTIAKFRSASSALVVSNAVKIDGMESIEDFEGVSLDQIKAFDVREQLLDLFDPKERRVLESVLED